MLRVHNVYDKTSSNGEGWRLAIFLAGCPHQCEGCQNPQTWDFDSGHQINKSEIIERINNNREFIKGITWSGGESIQERYYEDIKGISDYAHSVGLDVWGYTGFQFGDLADRWHNVFDTIVDGKFIKELASKDCKFRGSSNQNIWRKINGRFELVD